ncbi:MAG: LON peptidase substrate-binding domain-containing protein [Bacteroidota bacterium]
MPRELALFPLQIVVFPGEAVNLHIFEPRYRQLIQDCLDQGITFGIPSFQDGQVLDFGTEVELLGIEKRYPGGEMDIKTRAKGIFRVVEFFPTLNEKLYAGGQIRDYPHDEVEDRSVNGKIMLAVKKLFQAMRIKRTLPTHVADFRTYDVAHYVGFSTEQEYEFLLTFDARSRQEMLLEQINRVLPVVREMENMRNRAKLNGHFKNLIPPKI